MQRRLQLDNLRGMDSLTLEATITDALRRPRTELAPETFADLVAVASSPEAPSAIAGSLRKFLERIERDIADIPDGKPWIAFVEEITALEPARVPSWLREAILAEAAKETRHADTLDVTQLAVSDWEDEVPEPFALGDRGAKVERSTRAAQPRVAGSINSRKAIGVAGTKRKRTRRSGGERKAPRRIQPPRRALDEDKLNLLIQTISERLGHYTDNGLGEQVLMVGIAKQVKSSFPDVRGKDVLDALKTMDDRGLVRRSAGRWKLVRRWKG